MAEDIGAANEPHISPLGKVDTRTDEKTEGERIKLTLADCQKTLFYMNANVVFYILDI